MAGVVLAVVDVETTVTSVDVSEVVGTVCGDHSAWANNCKAPNGAP